MDLNHDVVLSDVSADVVELSEPVEGVVDKVDVMGGEVADAGIDKGLEEKGPKVKIGGLSSKVAINGGEGGAEDREGLEGPRFGTRGGIAASDKGLVLESEPVERFRSVDSSFSFEKDGGRDESLRECAEDEHLSAVKGDRSEARMNLAVHGGDSGESKNGQNVEQSLDALGYKDGNVDLESLGATGSTGIVTDCFPAVEVNIVGCNESLPEKDLNVSTEFKVETCDELENQALEVNVEAQTNGNKLNLDIVPETGVSKNAGNGLNAVIDLNTSMTTDGHVSSDGKGKSTSSELEFRDSDLVWGKVRSHPWWPGQICDPSAASEDAKKYSKRGTYLIAYFWDCTFAWNEAPRIKPFLEHFSQMEKQSDMEEFQDAIGCALDEVSRRIEFGLSCPCISKEVYAKLKTQIIVNAGIKEEASRRDGGDDSLSAASFEPAKLIKFIKKSAQFPYSKVGRLELVKLQAQLSAFYRWKGGYQLPEFNMLGGLLDEAEISQLEENQCGEVIENAIPVIKDEDLVQKSTSKVNSSRKRKDISGDSVRPSKKEKRLLDVVDKKYLSTPSGSEIESKAKASSKKRKAVDEMADDSAMKQRRSVTPTGDDSNSLQSKQTFKVGDRISRVASQLSGSSPLLKNYNAASAEAVAQDKGKVKTLSVERQTEKPAEREYPSPDDMLSQLCSTALDPMNGDEILNSTTTCFSEFRNTTCPDPPSPEVQQLSLKQMFGDKMRKKSARAGKKSFSSGIAKKSEPEATPHEQPSLECQNENVKLVSGAPAELNLNLDYGQKITGGSNESCEEDFSPTALILKFTDLGSVPSETNLNKIFSCYGPLTEVLRKGSRATVVFRRRLDAETAFSSTGKYSSFGTSLVSYSLNYSPSTPSKGSAPSNSRK